LLKNSVHCDKTAAPTSKSKTKITPAVAGVAEMKLRKLRSPQLKTWSHVAVLIDRRHLKHLRLQD
jgi:hypothetical protein